LYYAWKNITEVVFIDSRKTMPSHITFLDRVYEIQKLTNIAISIIYRNLKKKLNMKGNNDKKKGSGWASSKAMRIVIQRMVSTLTANKLVNGIDIPHMAISRHLAKLDYENSLL